MSLPRIEVTRSRAGDTVDGSALGASYEEVEWARAIKAAATTAGLGHLPDYVYLQHAIVAKANVYKAVRRIQRMCDFQRRYKVGAHGVNEAVELLRTAAKLQPAFLGATGLDDEERVVQHIAYAHFDPHKLAAHKDWAALMGGLYYLMQAANCDVQSMRNGMVFVADCSRMGWANFSFDSECRFADFLHNAYPFRCKQFAMLDAPSMLNRIANMLKMLLSPKMKKVIRAVPSVKFYGSTILPADLIPVEHNGKAQQELSLSFLEERLKRRAMYEEQYRL